MVKNYNTLLKSTKESNNNFNVPGSAKLTKYWAFEMTKPTNYYAVKMFKIFSNSEERSREIYIRRL